MDNEFESGVSDSDLFDDYTKDTALNKYPDEVDISMNKLLNKTVQLHSMITQFEMRLNGYMTSGNGDKMIYTGKPVVGIETTQRIMLLLQPFSQDSNLISKKDDFIWDVQMARTRYDLVILLTKNNDFEAVDTVEVWRSFTNLLVNIGDIIKGKNSMGLVEKYLGLSENQDRDYITSDRKRESAEI